MASLAPLLFESASEGDEIAQEIVSQTSVEMAKMILAVAKKMDKIETSLRVSYIGSVFEQKDILIPQIVGNLRNNFTKITINEPDFEPSIGALIWAFKEMGYTLSDKVLKNLNVEYEML